MNDGRRAAAIAGAAAYGWPARQLQIVGVTGTNGKTTTVNMMRHLLDDPAARSASIGTLGVLMGSEGAPCDGGGGLTTPGPIRLNGCSRPAIRASDASRWRCHHSLDQGRVEGVFFDVATFTNLTRDHLDYHVTMDRYFAAKAKLLDHVVPHGSVVFNLDDQAWAQLHTDRRRVAFSERVSTAEVHAEDIRFGPRGSEWTLRVHAERASVRLPLIGDFNVTNALGAAATAYALGMSAERIAERLSTMPQVPGRLEVIHESPTVLRDYAHTPYALSRALYAVRPFARQRLIARPNRRRRSRSRQTPGDGCDRRVESRSGHRHERQSSHRKPEAILDDIERGMAGTNHERIEDRRAAIARALAIAEREDVVVLAGKGHETYQVRGTTKYPFDEKAIVNELASDAATRT